LIKISFPLLDPLEIKNQIEGATATLKNPLNTYQKPLNEIYNEFKGKEGFEQAGQFFENMLYNDKKELGGGFLGKCHAVSASVGVGISTPGKSLVNLNVSTGYTSYAHIAKIRLSARGVLESLADVSSFGALSLAKKLAETAVGMCLMLAPEEEKQFNELKGWLNKNKSVINDNIVDTCAKALGHGFDDPMRITRILKDDAIRIKEYEEQLEDAKRKTMYAASDNTQIAMSRQESLALTEEDIKKASNRKDNEQKEAIKKQQDYLIKMGFLKK
jgi:uncharacterized protein (UPF0335 family)